MCLARDPLCVRACVCVKARDQGPVQGEDLKSGACFRVKEQLPFKWLLILTINAVL